jgi:hypothetical protein
MRNKADQTDLELITPPETMGQIQSLKSRGVRRNARKAESGQKRKSPSATSNKRKSVINHDEENEDEDEEKGPFIVDLDLDSELPNPIVTQHKDMSSASGSDDGSDEVIEFSFQEDDDDDDSNNNNNN